MNTVTVHDFLTGREVSEAVKLHDKLSGTGKFATTLCKQVIKPNILRINKAIGGENIPMYLAFAVEDAISRAKEESGQVHSSKRSL